MPTLLLEGHIEALQPITVSIGIKGALNKHVHMMPYFDAQGQRTMLPCIPGHNIKGALRSVGGLAALAEVYGADPGDPDTFGVLNINQVYNAASGGLVKPGPVSAEDLLQSRQNRSRDIHNSLFGSMRLNLKSLIEVDFAYPDPELNYPVKELRDRAYSYRRDLYRADPNLLNRHDEQDVDAFFTLQEENKDLSKKRGELKKVEDELLKLRQKSKGEEGTENARTKELTKSRDEIVAEIKILQEGGAEAMGRPLDTVEYIAAGVRMKHAIRVLNADHATIGYFLRCMEHFSNHSRIGGHASTGFGQIKMEYGLRIRRGVETEEAGKLTVSPYRYELESEHPDILEAKVAFAAAAKDREARFSLDLRGKA